MPKPSAIFGGLLLILALAIPLAAETRRRALTPSDGYYISDNAGVGICMIKDVAEDTRFERDPLVRVYHGTGDFFIRFTRDCIETANPRNRRVMSWYVHVVPTPDERRFVETYMIADTEYIGGETIEHPLPGVWQAEGFVDELPNFQGLLNFYEHMSSNTGE